ncbi:MAG TPA: hypothetical protein VIL30_08980 [Ramlibacter sp.]|jgi:hypothetical protein
MTPPRLATLLLLAAGLALVATAALFQAWGLLALLLVGGGGFAWYRLQVARSAASEEFFGDMGEETRLTGLQGAPSELPADRPGPAAPPRTGH